MKPFFELLRERYLFASNTAGEVSDGHSGNVWVQRAIDAPEHMTRPYVNLVAASLMQPDTRTVAIAFDAIPRLIEILRGIHEEGSRPLKVVLAEAQAESAEFVARKKEN